MATRFYMHPQTASVISPTYANWATGPDPGPANNGHNYLARKTTLSALETQTTNQVSIISTVTEDDSIGQFVSDPMPAQRFIGTVSCVVKVGESSLNNNANLALLVRVVSQDGAVTRGTLYTNLGTGSDTEFPIVGSSATRIINAQALTAVTTQPGDRLVVEFGAHITASAASGVASATFGSSAASDFALTSALTTSLNPWIEFSQDIWTSDTNNYQQFKVGNGMSTTEKIR